MFTESTIGKIRRRAGRPWAIALVTLALALSTGARADDLLHARVSHDSGGALVKGSGDADWSYATVNTLILPGDTVWVDQEGILEVEMSGGSFLRLADASKAEIDQLPPSANILAWTGSFYVQRISRSTGDFSFRTPAARINVDKDTQVRFDVVGDGATTVSVRWGRVVVDTEGGAPVAVTGGYRVYIDPGLLPSNPMPFDRGEEDSFDVWNRERAKTLALGDRAIPAAIQSSQPIGYSDLSSYGDWVYVDNRTYWRPTVVTGYVPYRSGYWSYVPSYGYTWVGSYPFCYTTSHYGRWTYNSGYGWLWCYDPVWSPAWAVTVRYGDYFVWAPLDLYDRPCYYGGATFTVGDVRISIGASSYCTASSLLYYGPCATYPAYSSIFNTAGTGGIYLWDIFNSGRYRSPYLSRLEAAFGSSMLVRDYAPQRVIRGLSVGTSSRLAATDVVNRLESTRGRAVFASADAGRTATGGRTVRTAINDGGRAARVRATALSSSESQDPRSVARRAQRNVATLRELDARPEGQRTRSTRTIRSASADAATAPPTTSGRSTSTQTLRNADVIRHERSSDRLLSRVESTDRTTRELRDRTTENGALGLSNRTERAPATSLRTERTSARTLTRAARQPEETPRPDFSRVMTRTERNVAPRETSGDSRTRLAPPSRTAVPDRTVAPGRSTPSARTPWPSQAERSSLSSLSLPSRAGTRTPTPSRTTPGASIDRTPPSPRVTSAPPARTQTPSFRTPSTRTSTSSARTSITTPRTTTRPTETPRVTSTPPSPRVSTPRTITRSPQVTTPAPRYEAPRSIAAQPRYQAPSVSVPRSTPSAPSPPSRIATPSPRYSAPTPPAPRSQRSSISVPSRSTFSAPSRSISSSPRSSAPSSSFNRSSVGGGRGRR